jgi:hypothetical protein
LANPRRRTEAAGIVRITGNAFTASFTTPSSATDCVQSHTSNDETDSLHWHCLLGWPKRRMPASARTNPFGAESTPFRGRTSAGHLRCSKGAMKAAVTRRDLRAEPDLGSADDAPRHALAEDSLWVTSLTLRAYARGGGGQRRTGRRSLFAAEMAARRKKAPQALDQGTERKGAIE